MNNPFDPMQIQENRAEREARRLKLRTNLLIALFCTVLLGFVAVLYQTQVVNGDSYRSSSNYRSPQRQTVDSVRGELLDRYGRVLVTNEVGYNVELDTTAMGGRRNEILTRLLELCREEDVTWSDSLPISQTAPWVFTTNTPFSYQTKNEDGEMEPISTWLGRLAKTYGWVEDPLEDTLPAGDLLAAMCRTFGLIEEGESPSREDRELAGVLYELYLRANDINRSGYVFARGVDISFISRVKENRLDGVKINTVTARRYNTAYAAHVLGRVAAIDPDELPAYLELGYPMNAYVGKEGVEQAFEPYLHGVSGVRLIEKDENGNISSQEWQTEPEPGDNVALTLDLSLQATVEDLLADYAATLDGSSGMAAVAVDMSGGVLAMASYPTYDLSTYAEHIAELSADAEGRPLLNRATMGLYAPGSTFKPLTAVAALSEGIITTRDTVDCTGLYYFYPDVHPPCWIWNSVGGMHGLENVTKAITDSCNIFFYDVGRRLGITALGNYAAQFGLGEYTGIEIAEYEGFMAGPETSEYFGQPWYGGATMYAAIGQEYNQFTPLQIANYVATLVNGGSHYQVHLLKEVKSSDYSQVVYEQEPVLLNSIDIAPEDLAAVKLGMYNLAQTASMARYFSSLPVKVGCKTGTAQVATKTANAVFVCFAPYDDPQIAICLVAEQGADGGSLARVASGILAQYFSTESSMNGVTGENALLR